MSYLKNLKWEMIIYSLLSILMGILMWKYPGKIMTGVCVILAMILFVMGIRNIIEYKRSNVIKDFYRYELVVGIVLIAAGILSMHETYIINYNLCYSSNNHNKWINES